VKERTNGQVQLGPGTLYGAIKRLLERDVVVETDERPDPELNDERRRYYRLTEFGQRVLRAEVLRLNEMVQQAQAKNLLPDTNAAQATAGA
jgi:DNA-binding PadR family transcriptional regulator